ncbi:MAG: GGDEF domain-containing protein [Treponema sp.]|jgi:diguanylate cyclase (GGDEF)-like protein|nr:GGDEF domain-containing protein [Treponema sp.]
MHLSTALNIIFGSWLVLALIIADYLHKHNTDLFHRYLFLKILVIASIPMTCDFIYYLFQGTQGKAWFYGMYACNSLYYIFQIIFLYDIFVFIDYSAFKDRKRSERICRLTWIVKIGIILLIVANLRFGFYFYVDENNVFHHGKYYLMHIVIGYGAAVFEFLDIIPVFEKRKDIFFMLSLIVLSVGIGSSVDLLFGTTSLFWPLFVSSALYIYLFIIKTDARLDGLTGLGNRFALNEFIAKLEKQTGTESWTITMIDMDHFKQINDTFGHIEGDNALRDMASIIKKCMPYSGFAARYGGDEFILAVRDGHEELLARIHSTIDVYNKQGIRPYQIQMSCGYGVYTTNSGQTTETFLASIDARMYKNKIEHRQDTDE